MSKSLQVALVSENQTLALGAELARVCADVARSQGLIVYLRGDLGAGKTTLTRGLLRALGFVGAVKSPTYTLVEPYELVDLTIHHFDLYRLHNPEELEFMGVRDYFQSGRLCMVEWPERGGEFLPAADIVLNIETAEAGRKAVLECNSDRGKLILERINAKNISNIS